MMDFKLYSARRKRPKLNSYFTNEIGVLEDGRVFFRKQVHDGIFLKQRWKDISGQIEVVDDFRIMYKNMYYDINYVNTSQYRFPKKREEFV